MAITKVIEIDVDVLNAQGGLDKFVGDIKNAEAQTESLKSQMIKAQKEVVELSEKFGATSKEATEAAKKAAILKDKIGDAKTLTDAFNPDAKFKSLSASLAGVAGGFAAVQGAMSLLGTENKDLEKQLLKVQSAMALASGVQMVGESIDSFKQLGAVVKSYAIVQKVITAAQWLWNAAMAANPIGAIVAVVVALIAAGYKLVKMFMDSAEANDKSAASIKKNTKALEENAKAAKDAKDKLQENNDQQFALAKAAGASAEELRKLNLKHAEEAVALNYSNAVLASNTFKRERNTLAMLKEAGASDEVIEAQEKLTKETYKEFQAQNEALKESYKNKRKVINENEVQIVQERTDANKKASDLAAEQATEAEKKRLDAILEARKEYLSKAKEMQKGFEDLEINVIAKQLEAEKLKATERERTLAAEAAGLTSLHEYKKQLSDADIALAKAEADAKKMLFDKTANTLSAGAALLGKNTAAGKTLAVASALINTYQGITTELATKTTTPFEIGLKIANVAIIAATGFKAVKNILAVKVPGSSGGGGAPSGNGGFGGGGSAGQAPSFNVVGNSGVNQLAQTLGQDQPPVQAYVVANNVTTAQGANRSIIQNASLG